MNGGYDEGYKNCPCFWGINPGSLVTILDEILPDVRGLHVLDLGCGEGKNAAHYASRGAIVRAIDVSEYAIRNARSLWGDPTGITWEVANVLDVSLPEYEYDIVIAYGLLHCLPSLNDISNMVTRIQGCTSHSGFNIVCAFNDRKHDLSAHPGFWPTFQPHEEFLTQYSGWRIVHESDTDLWETHPHNMIPHVHSMTRLLAQRTQN